MMFSRWSSWLTRGRTQYNVQFYNQGLYTTCDGLINASGGAFPGTALLEIPKSGIPLDMLVIGKPATAADATNGFMDPATLGTCVKQAKAKGWNGGVMVWQVRPLSLSESPETYGMLVLVRCTCLTASPCSTLMPTLHGSSLRRAAPSKRPRPALKIGRAHV